MNSFEELEVWKECRIFKIMVNDYLKNFPESEKYRLRDQLIRSSRSINANIAEGYGRYSYIDNVRFCRFARGSLNETLNHLIDAYDENYISLDTLSKIRIQYSICHRLLNGYINYLIKSKKTEKLS